MPDPPPNAQEASVGMFFKGDGHDPRELDEWQAQPWASTPPAARTDELLAKLEDDELAVLRELCMDAILRNVYVDRPRWHRALDGALAAIVQAVHDRRV